MAAFFDPPEKYIGPIRSLREQGLSFRRIALEFGCDKNTVSDFAKRYLGDSERNTALKVLIIDIETIPGLAYVWSQKEPWIPYQRIIRDPEPICFAAKWLGDHDMEFWATWHQGKVDMVTRAHELLSEAHAVVTYNGDRFDLPHLNLEILRNGSKPPQPYKSVDLFKTVRRKFKFTSNKLGHVGEKLEIGSKLEHEGFALWEKVMAGDTDAQARMEAYNIEDVRLTERLYTSILPWIEGHPSFAAIAQEGVCPNCGADELQRHDDYFTKTRGYALYQCGGCGKWSRETKSHLATNITESGMS